MSRGQSRKGITAHGRNTNSSNSISERKGDQNELESRSDVNHAREVAVGLTQALKSDENASSSRTSNGPIRALPKTRNDNSPMHESSNASMCQPIPVALANGQYKDRFGCLHAIGLTQTVSPNRATSDQDIPTEMGMPARAPDTKPEGVKISSNVPLRTQVKGRQVCRLFLVGRCEHDARCYYKHPPKEDIARLRTEAAQARPKIDEICPRFLMHRRCFWGVLCDRIHQSPNSLPADQLDVQPESTPTMIFADNQVRQSAIAAPQGPRIDTTSIPLPLVSVGASTKAVQSLERIDNNASKIMAESSLDASKKSQVVCNDFLNNQCPKGNKCLRNHPPFETARHSTPSTSTVKHVSNATFASGPPTSGWTSFEDENSSNQPVSIPKVDSTGAPFINVRRRKLQEVCRLYLIHKCRRGKYCRRLHLSMDQYNRQKKLQEVDELSDSSESENTWDAERPDPELEDDYRSSRSLTDSSAAGIPFVNVPTTDQLRAKTGRRKKKKETVSTNVGKLGDSANKIVVAQSNDQSLAIPTSTTVSSTVFKLPFYRRCSNVAAEHADDSSNQRNHTTEDSFSVDSQSSDSSVPVFSDAAAMSTSQSSISQSNCAAMVKKISLPPEICRDWLRGHCLRMKCRYSHVASSSNNNFMHEEQIPLEPPGLPSRMAPPAISNRDITVQPHRVDCFKCTLGLCDGVHARSPLPREPIPSISQTSVTFNRHSNSVQKESLELPQRSSLPPVSISTDSVPVGQPSPSMTVTILEHTKVQLGEGFEVQEITTGFESRWVVLSNIQSTVSEKTIRRMLKPFGQVDDLRMPATPAAASMTIKALFSTSSEAMQALSALNGALLFDRRVGARLPVNNTGRGNGTLQDSSVKIEWEIPGKLGFAGYTSQGEAEAAVSAANGSTLHETCIGAVIYEGLPTLGAVNVRFVGLPPSVHAEDLKQFGQPEAVMLERPNYSSLAHAVKCVQGLLDDFGQVLGFEMFPAPYKDGMARGLAHFSSPSVAQTASNHLNGRRPYFIGKGKLIARHVQVLSYTLPIIAYNKLASDIAWLRRSFWTRGRGAALFVVDRKAERLQDPSLPVFIKLSSEDVGELGHLKSEFEKLLHGEKIMQGGKVAWDGFFERPAGSAFIHELERNNPDVEIQKSIGRRTITLFGPVRKRQQIRQVLLDKIARMQAQQTRTIPLAGRLIALFMSAELMDLQKHLGRENVVLDLVRRTLTIRGNDAAYEAAQRVVNAVPKRQTDDRRDDMAECPVCFNEVVSPIQLRCGHCWCRQCFANYLVAAIDNKIFPLVCLGNEATCSQLVSVHNARDVLTADDFDRVVNASFFSYVYARPDEFHYCPTPDCPQIYRSAPPDTVLQCPSCLARICPSCHVEAHDGISCINRDLDGEKLFKEWMEAHDVKCCPGCKSSIEKIAGCNHMTCSRCQTHICWVCLETFPKAEGIYDHMRAAHGGIGL